VERLRVLITIKTYPIPSKKYEELVCTAGVKENGEFVRLYPINFRELDYAKRYRKYQWMEVSAEKHTGRDVRKESYRPDSSSIRMVGEPLDTDKGTWMTRARYALAQKSRSMEELQAMQKSNSTSLGVFKPKEVRDLLATPDAPDWKESFKAALRQQKLFDERTATKEPPRKIPWKFQYRFACDDSKCKGHKMMIEDWEVGALYWNCVDNGATSEEAKKQVQKKFLDEICGSDRDTHFFTGTVLEFGTWVIIGTFWPKLNAQPGLF
jgi:hypothetical protein